MKNLSLVIISLLILAGCSKSTQEASSPIQESKNQSVSTKESAAALNAEEDLKKEASLVMLGTGNDERLLKSFNHYISVSSNLTYSPEQALNLRSQLIKIFNDRINLYVNLLNASLMGSRSVQIEIDDSDPKSALRALQTLYSSLGTKKARSQLTLADQYLVFDLTIALKDKFSAQNQETIPTKTIVNFLKEQVALNKKTPGDTFFAYQIANKILDSNDALYTIFFPIFSQVEINKNSSATEIELFRRISMYTVQNNFTDFIKNRDEVSLFFKNISFIASNKIEKLNNQGFDQRLGFFETIDYSFKSHNAYLGKIASEQVLDIEAVARIQDAFIQTTYFDFLLSLNKDTSIYTRLFQESCLNFTSNELQLIVSSYMLSIDKNNSIPCIKYLKDKVENNSFEFVTTLKTFIDKEMNELNTIENPELKNYFKAYNESSLSNLLLNIIAKNPLSTSSDQQKRHSYIYSLYNTSKLSTINALKARNKIETNNISLLNESADSYLKIPAGVYKGNLNSRKILLLHPLAVIIPENSIHSLKITSAIGGRIDGNFKIKDYNQVLNQDRNNGIFRGSIPIQHDVVDSSYTKTKKEPCRGKNLDGCADNYSDVHVPQFSRSVTPAATPLQAYEGEAGISGAEIQLEISKRNIIETSIYSFGLQGYKGNRGFSAPLCTTSNEYRRFNGSQYTNLPSPSGPVNEYRSYAGKSGNGGLGGRGGKITIRTGTKEQYPSLSLGGPGGNAGDVATCTYPGQSDELFGSQGAFGINGLIEIKI